MAPAGDVTVAIHPACLQTELCRNAVKFPAESEKQVRSGVWPVQFGVRHLRAAAVCDFASASTARLRA